jgi:hypothetical protein
MAWFAWLVCKRKGHAWKPPYVLYEGSDGAGGHVYTYWHQCRRCYADESCVPTMREKRDAWYLQEVN